MTVRLQHMAALVIEKPGEARLVRLPIPAPAPGEAVMRVEACGVCGTDAHIYKGEYLGDYPIVPGHEAAGVISAVGEGVEHPVVGARVALEPNISCGRCRCCRQNRQNFCANWTAVGVTRPGAFAEYVAAPAAQFFEIGALPFEVAAFMEPLSCVLHGLERIGVRAGEHVLVLGAGPIGLLMLQAARALGASHVTAADSVQTRLDAAHKLGAAAVNVSAGMDALLETGDDARDGYDLVVEAAGVQALVPEAIALARPGGRVLLFGVAPRDASVAVRPFEIFRKGLTLASSYTSLRNSLQALEMLASRQVRVDGLVTHRLGIGEFEEAMRLLADPCQALKIQLRRQ